MWGNVLRAQKHMGLRGCSAPSVAWLREGMQRLQTSVAPRFLAANANRDLTVFGGCSACTVAATAARVVLTRGGSFCDESPLYMSLSLINSF